MDKKTGKKSVQAILQSVSQSVLKFNSSVILEEITNKETYYKHEEAIGRLKKLYFRIYK